VDGNTLFVLRCLVEASSNGRNVMACIRLTSNIKLVLRILGMCFEECLLPNIHVINMQVLQSYSRVHTRINYSHK
jgi:hypothetical protein